MLYGLGALGAVFLSDQWALARIPPPLARPDAGPRTGARADARQITSDRRAGWIAQAEPGPFPSVPSPVPAVGVRVFALFSWGFSTVPPVPPFSLRGVEGGSLRQGEGAAQGAVGRQGVRVGTGGTPLQNRPS